MSSSVCRTCKYCNNTFVVPSYATSRGRGLFCSKLCKSNSTTKNLIPRVLLKCHVCNKQFERLPRQLQFSKSRKYFCSLECKGIDSRTNPSRRQSKPYREKALKHYGQICMRCGFDKYPVFRVHHKDRDRNNNELSNLEILCPTCHDVEHFLAGDGFYKHYNPEACICTCGKPKYRYANLCWTCEAIRKTKAGMRDGT